MNSQRIGEREAVLRELTWLTDRLSAHIMYGTEANGVYETTADAIMDIFHPVAEPEGEQP